MKHKSCLLLLTEISHHRLTTAGPLVAVMCLLLSAAPAPARGVITAGFDQEVEQFAGIQDHAYSIPGEPLAAAGGIYYMWNDGIHGREWWFSDGTPAGTAMVCDRYAPPEVTALTSAVVLPDGVLSARGVGPSKGPAGEYFKMSGSNAASVRLVPFSAPEGWTLSSFTGAAPGGVFSLLENSGEAVIWFQRANSTAPAERLITCDEEDGVAWVSPSGRLYATGGREVEPGVVERGLFTTTGTSGNLVKLPIPWDDEIMRSTPLQEAGGLTFIHTQLYSFDPGGGGARYVYKLWRSDGTVAGTFPVLTTPPRDYQFFEALPDGNRLWQIQNRTGGAPSQLYLTDGTAAGTAAVMDLPSAIDGWNFLGATANRVLLYGHDIPCPLWCSDGTLAGSQLLTQLPRTPLQVSPPYQGWIYFWIPAGPNLEMWRTDGTAAELFRVFLRSTASSDPFRPAVANSLLFFTAGRPDGKGHGLWRTDGTLPGTILLSDLTRRVPPAFDTIQTTPDAFYFSTHPLPDYTWRTWRCDSRPVGSGGTEIWNALTPEGVPLRLIDGHYQSTDGHLALRHSYYEGSGFALHIWHNESGFGVLPGGDRWLAEESNPGGFSRPVLEGPYSHTLQELDRRSGTHEPDGILKTRHHPAATPLYAGRCGSRDFFWAAVENLPAPPGYRLFSSDGTVAGSGFVSELFPAAVHTETGKFISVSDTAWVIHRQGRLYTSPDGSPATLQPGLSYVNHPLAMDGALYFTAADMAAGMELWRWQPGSAPALLKDIVPGPGSSCPTHLRAIGHRLWFSADDGIHGYEPWITDGTAAGTHLLADLRTGPLGSSPAEFTSAAGCTVFAADNGVTGRELWQSSGTAAGTRGHDSYPGPEAMNPSFLVPWNDSVIHFAKPTDFWMSFSSVTLALGVFTPDPTPAWALWAENRFPPSTPAFTASPLSDPDKDGADNFSEYAFSADPLNSGSFPSLASAAGPSGTLTFQIPVRRDPGITYAVEHSGDLQTWTPWRFHYAATAVPHWESLTPGLTLLTEQPSPDGTGFLTVRIPSPAGTVRTFTRATATGQ